MIEQWKNKIIKGDTYDLIKEIPSGSIDLILCDPPYQFLNPVRDGKGTGVCSGKMYVEELYGSMEKNFANGITDEFLEECVRVCKKFHAYFFCNKNQIKQYLDFADRHKFLFDILVICKNNPIPTCNNKYLSDLEYIMVIREKGTGLNTTYKTASKFFPITVHKRQFGHPTEKSVDIVKTLITNSSNEGDLVLDPFLGSGTTAVAAQELKRNFIGFEMEEKYCQVAKSRTGCEIVETIDSLINKVVVEGVANSPVIGWKQPNKIIEHFNKKHICPTCDLWTDDNGICEYCKNE